jgi:hypothetical protein
MQLQLQAAAPSGGLCARAFLGSLLTQRALCCSDSTAVRRKRLAEPRLVCSNPCLCCADVKTSVAGSMINYGFGDGAGTNFQCRENGGQGLAIDATSSTLFLADVVSLLRSSLALSLSAPSPAFARTLSSSSLLCARPRTAFARFLSTAAPPARFAPLPTSPGRTRPTSRMTRKTLNSGQCNQPNKLSVSRSLARSLAQALLLVVAGSPTPRLRRSGKFPRPQTAVSFPAPRSPLCVDARLTSCVGVCGQSSRAVLSDG